MEKMISEEISGYSEETVRSLPWPAAHEYRRIFELLEAGEQYGALLQLKDAAEVLVKFYASAGLAMLYADPEKKEEGVRLLYEATDKILSLGDWVQIVVRLKKIYRNEKELLAIWNCILDLADPDGDISIVEWRNRCLGHGALGYAHTKEYREAFVTVLNGITEMLEQQRESFEKVRLTAEQSGEIRELSGADCELPEADELAVSLEGGKRRISLFPFVSADRDKLFFFDTFLASKKRLDLLNYYYGIKKTCRTGLIYRAVSRIHEQYAGSTASQGLSETESYEAEVFSYEMEEILKKNSQVNDACRADYLEEWLNRKMEAAEKGVFWLQAEKGMGKTTAVQQLERRGLVKLHPENAAVRALYVNNTYNSSPELVLQELELLFTHDRNGKMLIKGEGIPLFDRNAPDRKREFASYLSGMKRILDAQGRLMGKNLLLVMDGIDAAPEAEICDLIPDASMLEEGIFILLTSRTGEEVSHRRRTELDKLRIPAEDRFLPGKEFLAENMLDPYLAGQMPGLGAEERVRLIASCGGSFSLLHFLVSVSREMERDPEESRGLEETVQDFVSYIRKTYSGKYCRKILLLMEILAETERSLSLKQLSLLLSEEQVSFETAGMIQDMSGFLEAEHTGFCAYYEVREELRVFLRKALREIPGFDGPRELSERIREQAEEERSPETEIRWLSALFSGGFYRNLPVLYEIFPVTEVLRILLHLELYGDTLSEADRMKLQLPLLYQSFYEYVLTIPEQETEKDESYRAVEEDFCHMTLNLLSSCRSWENWYRNKREKGETEEISAEMSRLHLIFQEISADRMRLAEMGAGKENAAYLLLARKENELLMQLQEIHRQNGDDRAVIRYTEQMLTRMEEAESEAFRPDRALEYRYLEEAYRNLGDRLRAAEYARRASADETEAGKISPAVRKFMKFRSGKQEFDRLYENADQRNAKDRTRMVSIRRDFYGLAQNAIREDGSLSAELFGTCCDLEGKMARYYHRKGKADKCRECFARIRELYEKTDADVRYLYHTQMLGEMALYAANLAEYRDFEAADQVAEAYLMPYESARADLEQFSAGADARSFDEACLHIALYLVNRVLHPERKELIDTCRAALSEEDMRQCERILRETGR